MSEDASGMLRRTDTLVRFSIGILYIGGFLLAVASLILKAVAPGEVGTVSLVRGEAVEFGDNLLVLRDFRVPKYPSGKPRQFESDVHVIDRAHGEATHATVSVNHPLRWHGWWIYQNAYDAATESATVLEARRDPWLPLAASGGVLLLLGALLFTLKSRGGGTPPPRDLREKRALTCILARFAAAALVLAAPLFIVLRAVFRAEPVPALQSPLMAPHVAAYVASYLLFVFAAFGLFRRLMPLAFSLMTLGLVLGALWGKICWGDFWQYDPKEMWSLATWLVYGAYFLLRRHPHAERFLRALGAVLVVLTATWVNFSRLFSGLHSYI